MQTSSVISKIVSAFFKFQVHFLNEGCSDTRFDKSSVLPNIRIYSDTYTFSTMNKIWFFERILNLQQTNICTITNFILILKVFSVFGEILIRVQVKFPIWSIFINIMIMKIEFFPQLIFLRGNEISINCVRVQKNGLN